MSTYFQVLATLALGSTPFFVGCNEDSNSGGSHGGVAPFRIKF